MIKSFRCKQTERLFSDESTGKFSSISKAARRKLEMLNAAMSLDDLRSPPGNRLEALKGDRLGQYSIRINEQWRLCFIWSDGDAFSVEIVDYHD
jgi:proteic killer suppression protein